MDVKQKSVTGNDSEYSLIEGLPRQATSTIDREGTFTNSN
jgi:hypothetical protein